MTVGTSASVKELLKQLTEICNELYSVAERRILPQWPWVLVKVLPKEQTVHGIILPGSQNKVMYEGLVLETWKPFDKLYKGDDGERYTVPMQSLYKPGDHVLFPHYAGQPPGDLLDEKEFRLVPEETPWDKDGKAMIMSALDYQQKTKEQLEELVGHQGIAEKVLEKFYVIPKVVKTHTVSGA